MKTTVFKSWILCFAVVPAVLLAMYVIERFSISTQQGASGTSPTEIGFVGSAGDAKGAESIPTKGILYVEGWAADTAKGAPVDRVTVYVDGISEGSALLGFARPDVEKYYRRSDYLSSGWNLSMSASGLSPGKHTVTAIASGPSGTAQLTASKTITILVDPDGGRK